MTGEEIEDEKKSLMRSIRDYQFGEGDFIAWWASVRHEYIAVDEEHARSVYFELHDLILTDIIQ